MHIQIRFGLLTGCCVLALAGPAQAQYIIQAYQPQPLYPYVAQQYAYPAPQYAPPPVSAPAYSQVRSPVRSHVRPHAPKPASRLAAKPGAARASAGKTDPALVAEWRNRHPAKDHDDKDKTGAIDSKVDNTIVVREKPVVHNTYRVVDDPPTVVTREIDENGTPLAPESRAQLGVPGRVIHAEAEVTILGPDRMSIRLYRKRDGADANAKAVGAPAQKTSKN